MKTSTEAKKSLILETQDNLAVALRDLPAGERVEVGRETLLLTEAIPLKHKFATEAVPRGGPVYLYGVLVGKATVSRTIPAPATSATG